MTGTDADPLGLPCHVTDFVDGLVVDDAAKATSYLGPEALRVASTGIVTTLAELHAVDPQAVGLGDLGPREDYNGRQVRRWRRLLSDLAGRGSELDAGRTATLESLGAELGSRLPTDRSGRIVHGDYRLGNAITGPDGTIRAILDWELVTLGEPLADLALLLVYWDPPPQAMLGTVVPTAAPGTLTEQEAIDLYAERSGADLADLDLYRALACWRLACLCLRTALRFDSGVMGDGDPWQFVRTTDVWTGLARRHLG